MLRRHHHLSVHHPVMPAVMMVARVVAFPELPQDVVIVLPVRILITGSPVDDVEIGSLISRLKRRSRIGRRTPRPSLRSGPSRS